MARLTAQNVENIPYGPLGIIAMPGCEALGYNRFLRLHKRHLPY